jgi:hypothetical protein|tara:strand:- start:281 stop:430 length:150 start_codon:yes stop_codon:yes gene_type:complete
MEEIDKLRKKIKKEAEKNIEVDDSDIPIHEKHVKEEHIKQLKKNKRNTT